MNTRKESSGKKVYCGIISPVNGSKISNSRVLCLTEKILEGVIIGRWSVWSNNVSQLMSPLELLIWANFSYVTYNDSP